MILIVGGTGDLGGRITHRLLQQGERIRALTRTGTPEQRLPDGVERVSGDLKEPESLLTACSGVDTIVTTANASARGVPDTVDSVDRTGNLNLIEAAETAGVGRFLFVSALGAHPEHPMPLLRAKGLTEQRLRVSSMTWTVLQPNVFMDRLIPIVVGDAALARRPVTLVGSGQRKHSFVAMDDVAAYAVAALHDSRADRQTILVAGPEPVSWHDIVVAFENELNRTVPIRMLPPGAAVSALPEFVTQLLTALDGYDSAIDITQTSGTFGVEPTYLADYVHSFVGNTDHELAG